MWPFSSRRGEKQPEFPRLEDCKMAESGYTHNVKGPKWHRNLDRKYEVIARVSVERTGLKEPLYKSQIPVPISGYRSNLQRRMRFKDEDYKSFVLVFKPLLEDYESLAEKVNKSLHL